MSIDSTDKVDFIGVNTRSGEVCLTISDHLDGSDENTHLFLLQQKLNAYLAFIESGELIRKYPDSQGRQIVIEVILQHPLTHLLSEYLAAASDVVEKAGFKLRWRVLE